MIGHQFNPSPIRLNPSRKCDGFAKVQRVGPCQFSESVTNPSRPGVTDFGGCKSINNREISLSSINTSRCHAPAREGRPREPAWRLRTREGVCDGFKGRILLPDQPRRVGARSPTFAPCGGVAPSVANDAKVALRPTGANVANRSAIPPAVGTPENLRRRMARGNRPPVRHSFFQLSDFFPQE
jgi:hypothetical protein